MQPTWWAVTTKTQIGHRKKRGTKHPTTICKAIDVVENECWRIRKVGMYYRWSGKLYFMGVFDSIILSNPMFKIPMMLYVAGLRPHETGVVVWRRWRRPILLCCCQAGGAAAGGLSSPLYPGVVKMAPSSSYPPYCKCWLRAYDEKSRKKQERG